MAKASTKTATRTAPKTAGPSAKKATPKKTTAKKTTAKKTTVKKTTDGSSGGKSTKPQRRVITLNGRPAKNRHFLLDRGLYGKVVTKCSEDGLQVSDVLRHGIALYGEAAPSASRVKPAMQLLPAATQRSLKKVWRSGDSELRTHFVAALARAGWTTQVIADSLVASGAVEKMTRQAVNLRVNKAPEVLREDVPKVPALGPRRAIVSARKGQKGKYKPQAKVRDNSHDLSFRVADDDYARAARRAEHEGAMMSAVLDEILTDYLDGAYDADLVHGQRN